MQTKTIKLWFTDFWKGFDPKCNFITNVLKQSFHIVLSDSEPDFLFYSCFGRQHTLYKCVRISFLGENCSPDFNWCDYAIGCDWLNFGDRYLRFPLFSFSIQANMGKGLSTQEALTVYNRPKFCNFLYSNSTHADPIRERLFHALSAYRRVDAGGACCNNVGFRVQDHHLWQKEYKFTIACENSKKPGYTTEKLANALLADTIPLYWGNPEITRDINPHRIIQVCDYSCMDDLVAKVHELDVSPEAFCNIVSQPWFTAVHNVTPELDSTFISFLHSIVNQSPEHARRIPQYGFTDNYQRQTKKNKNFGILSRVQYLGKKIFNLSKNARNWYREK